MNNKQERKAMLNRQRKKRIAFEYPSSGILSCQVNAPLIAICLLAQNDCLRRCLCFIYICLFYHTANDLLFFRAEGFCQTFIKLRLLVFQSCNELVIALSEVMFRKYTKEGVSE